MPSPYGSKLDVTLSHKQILIISVTRETEDPQHLNVQRVEKNHLKTFEQVLENKRV